MLRRDELLTAAGLLKRTKERNVLQGRDSPARITSVHREMLCALSTRENSFHVAKFNAVL